MREFGRALNHDDYLKLEGEFEKRTLSFIQKNAAAKRPFFVAYWPALGSFLPSPRKLTTNGGVTAELITPQARDFPLQGIENARPETQALGQSRVNGKDLPFNPLDVINQVKGWKGIEFDQAE